MAELTSPTGVELVELAPEQRGAAGVLAVRHLGRRAREEAVDLLVAAAFTPSSLDLERRQLELPIPEYSNVATPAGAGTAAIPILPRCLVRAPTRRGGEPAVKCAQCDGPIEPNEDAFCRRDYEQQVQWKNEAISRWQGLDAVVEDLRAHVRRLQAEVAARPLPAAAPPVATSRQRQAPSEFACDLARTWARTVRKEKKPGQRESFQEHLQIVCRLAELAQDVIDGRWLRGDE